MTVLLSILKIPGHNIIMHIRFTGFTYHAFAVCSGILPDSWRDKAGTDYVKSAWSMVSYGFAVFPF